MTSHVFQYRVAVTSALSLFATLCCSIELSAQVAIDANISADQGTAKSTVGTAAFSTSSGNELLLAFISADHLSGANTTVTNVTGAGLTWALVKRTNVQSGTAEIWRTFASSVLTNVTVTATLSHSVASSLTVMSFIGVDTSGSSGSGAIGATGTGNANPGAPTATLITTRNGSVVVGVGNDFDNALARTPGPNQTIVHDDLAPVGDTYWVQMLNSLILMSGTSVTVNDVAPSGDRYNLSICEILVAIGGGSPTYTLSGNVSPLPDGSGVTIALTGDASGSFVTDRSGNYSIGNLANGTYTVTPSKSGYTFTPPSQTIKINGANSPNVNFTATAVQQTWTISGTIGPASHGVGTLLTLSGAASMTTTADASGNYSFAGLSNGSYTVTPSKNGYTFNPPNLPVSINGANAPGINFTAVSTQTWNISGTINPASDGMGAVVILSGSPSAYATADASGSYSFKNLPNGNYTVTPTKTGYTFNPGNLQVTISGANSTGNNFLPQAVQPLPTLNYPDLTDIIPPGEISIVGTGANRVFQYTHDTFEAGTGPLEIQPVYNPASGNYQGVQHIYSVNASGRLVVSQSILVAGAFVFDADHGHFHFPFASYGLYISNVDGTIGGLIASSTKVGFCIDNSFIYDSFLPNAGFDSFGSCGDPTTLRGLSIAAVDEYDQPMKAKRLLLELYPMASIGCGPLSIQITILLKAIKATTKPMCS